MDGDLASLSATPVQILKAKDLRGREKYVKVVANYMEDHRVLQQLMELSTTQEPDEAKIEAIDRDISRAMHHSMRAIHKIHIWPFSRQIKQARLQQRFYKLHLSMKINNLDFTSQLQSLLQAPYKEMPAPPNLEEARKLLRDAQKNVTERTQRAAEL